MQALVASAARHGSRLRRDQPPLRTGSARARGSLCSWARRDVARRGDRAAERAGRLRRATQLGTGATCAYLALAKPPIHAETAVFAHAIRKQKTLA